MIGGGTGGCEFARAFGRLGSEVTVVEATDRLLPDEDERASRLVTDALADAAERPER